MTRGRLDRHIADLRCTAMGDPLIGVRKKLHVVDLETRRSAPEVEALLDRLGGAEFASRTAAVARRNQHPVCSTLDELRGHLRRVRAALDGVAAPLGLGVVSAGTVPLADLTSDAISAGARTVRGWRASSRSAVARARGCAWSARTALW